MVKKKSEESSELPPMDLGSLLGLNIPKDFSDISIENYRVHLIFDDIDKFSIQDACEFLLKSFFEDPDSPVTLIINSPGGSCDDGFALIDLMKTLPMTIRTVAMGEIMSMGFLIFVSGTKGHRFLSPSSSYMSHQFSNVLHGKDFEIEAAMKIQKMTRQVMTEHLQKCTGLSAKQVKEKLLPQHDVYLTATECLILGVGDMFITPELFREISKDTDVIEQLSKKTKKPSK